MTRKLRIQPLKTCEGYIVRRMILHDVPLLYSFYDQLSRESRRYFRPGFMGTSSIRVRWFLYQYLLLANCNRFLNRLLSRLCPHLTYYFIVALDNDERIIGVGWLQSRKRDPEGLYSAQLGIASLFQRKGVGSAIINELFRAAKRHIIQRIGLTVFRENTAAINFYLKHGFKVTGFVDNNPTKLNMELIMS